MDDQNHQASLHQQKIERHKDDQHACIWPNTYRSEDMGNHRFSVE